MSVDHGRDRGGTSSIRIWSGGTLMQIVPPPQILSYRYKNQRSVAFKIRQIRFWPGSAPDPAGGAYDAPPDPLVGWRGTPLPWPTPLGTDPPSALAMRPPRSPARSTPMNDTHYHTYVPLYFLGKYRIFAIIQFRIRPKC